MTKIIVFEQDAINALQLCAHTEALETCASGLVAPAGQINGTPRYVVRELKPVPESAYQSRTTVSASISPAYCVELSNRARSSGLGVVLAHTHPGKNAHKSFSSIDDHGEIPLKDYFERRMPGSFHATAIFTEDDGKCRQLGSNQLAILRSVGKEVHHLSDAAPDTEHGAERFSRQVLVFGKQSQKKLGLMKVAIVGLGGTGSLAATELAYLGVSNFVLIDPDVVDMSNLNRLVGATVGDVGKAKVEQAANWIRTINHDAACTQYVGDIVDDHTAKLLLDCDFIFLCTDSHASRAVVNQITYQYLIPCIDMGVAIHSANGSINHIVGRAQMISSGLPCLICSGWIDANQVRIEMMSYEQRQQDPYFKGDGVPQPAVVSLNGAITSVAVTMFLSAVVGIPSSARMVLYDAMLGSMRPAVMNPHPNCIVCSPDGALARGDSWELPTRHASN
jgi:molybdopterin/thiamine biosynthesis adenylyltransferase